MANVCKMAMLKKANGKKTFFVTCDSFGKPKPPHWTIWVNMPHKYYHVLDPNIDNINVQPHHLMNEVRYRLEEN